MWGDMSLWNVQGPLLHSEDHIVPRIVTVDYTFKVNNVRIFILYARPIYVNNCRHFKLKNCTVHPPPPKPHILFYSDGLAIQQGLPNIGHVKVKIV